MIRSPETKTKNRSKIVNSQGQSKTGLRHRPTPFPHPDTTDLGRRGPPWYIPFHSENPYSGFHANLKTSLMETRYRAYAKINLGLEVLRKRPDGYHDIRTVFHRIDLFDEIGLEPAARIELVTEGRDVPVDGDNLCLKAAYFLREAVETSSGVRIHLRKTIPVGAGLGGGSADAAVILRTLPNAWERTVEDTRLHDIALRLGSDVPFFLGEDSALGLGRGENLRRFSLDIPYTILLCNPDIHISTAWAYSQVSPVERPPSDDLVDRVKQGMNDPSILVRGVVNDFEIPVFRAYPAVRDLKEGMFAAGAPFALMSGSGSSVYGFFSDEEVATRHAERLRSKGFWVSVTPPHFRPPSL